ncbi:O-antigen ligase family protein [Microbacterium murale]|uniref:Inorganic carbon (HCO3(-)) transporter n=1 Tax=Microbacterium murale TaxID=1081040 RepID=A0ABU0PB66_9MICO|nr:O-antigen ligase family protein [Microbacterium murale]MDQ0644580.1 putative inorganic carbon (HCO3(-)) transporter [Microbacterium murale]
MITTNSIADETNKAAEQKISRGMALLLFIFPITAVMAGAVSISGVTPHVVTSALFAIVGVFVILRPHRKISQLARTTILLVLAWVTVTLVHLLLRGVPLGTEVAISLSGIVILLGVATIRASYRTFDAVIVGWTAAYLLSAAVAILEKFFGYVPQNNFLITRGYALEDVGLSSLFGNPNGFGLFLLASSIVFMPYALSANKRSVRFLYCLLQASTLYFMLETNSRTGLTCLLIVITITLWKLLQNQHVGRLLLLLVAAALIIAQMLTPDGNTVVNGLRESSIFTDSDDGSFLLRFNLVRNGLIFTAESPLIGIGPDVYESLMQTRRDIFPTNSIINPHNGLIEILSQYGVIVFFLFALLLIQSGIYGWKLMRSAQSVRDRDYVLGLAQLLLIVFLPFAATLHSTFLGAPAAWIYICALVALGRMASVSETDPALRAKPRSRAARARAGVRRYYA